MKGVGPMHVCSYKQRAQLLLAAYNTLYSMTWDQSGKRVLGRSRRRFSKLNLCGLGESAATADVGNT